MSDVLHVPRDARVRFARQDIGDQTDPEPWLVTRSLASRRPSLEGASASGRLLVIFRMVLRFREVLATLATCSNQPMGIVFERILDHPRAKTSPQLTAEILAPRGRPSAHDESSFNCAVEIQEAGQIFSTQLVGHWADQSLYLSLAHVERLESAARAAGLSADQAIDAFIANHLAESLQTK